MNVLFVGAHPDDIETFAGGTAALYAARGDKVFFCVATNGNVGSSTLSKEQIAAVRHQEAHRGAKAIGAELIWLDFDDEFLLDSVETRHAFIEAFRIARPDVIFCHWRAGLQSRPFDLGHDRRRMRPHGHGPEHQDGQPADRQDPARLLHGHAGRRELRAGDLRRYYQDASPPRSRWSPATPARGSG